MMVDTGAAVSACPLRCAPEIPVARSSRNATLTTASGAKIEHAGQKMIEYKHGEGSSVNFNFEVANVTRPLVALGGLQRVGVMVVMGPDGSFVTRGRVAKPTGSSLELEHANGACSMRLTRGDNSTKVLAPIEVKHDTETNGGLVCFAEVGTSSSQNVNP